MTMSQKSQSEKANLSQENYLLRCNVPQQVSSQSSNIGLILKADTLTRLQSTNIIPTSEHDNNKSSASSNQQTPQVQSQTSLSSSLATSCNKMDSANLRSNSQKRDNVLCRNCGVLSTNVQVCSYCSKPLSNQTLVKLGSVQPKASKRSPNRSAIASRFYGGNGLKEFTRFAEGSNARSKPQKRNQGTRPAFKTTVADCIMISDSSDDEVVVSVDTSSSSKEDTSNDPAASSKENCISEAGESSVKRLKIHRSTDKMPTWQCHAIHLEVKSIHVGQKKLIPSTAMRMSGVGFSVSLQESIFELKWIAIKLVELSSNPIEPCLYLTINNECLGCFRSEQGMHPGVFPYYDPDGTADQKYIIFYIDKSWFAKHHHQMRTMLLTFRANLKQLNSFFKEITVNDSSRRQAEVAQASLEREGEAVPQKSGSPAKEPGPSPPSSPELPRMTTRARRFDAEEKDVSICFSGPRIQLAIYPSPPAKGGIVITNEDAFCLNDHEFLNDVIIDFYLKYTMEEIVSETDRARSHVFSSFFYKRLTQTTQGGVHALDTKQLGLQERRHARVRNWSRGVDLFSKDFIFIPINDASHWYLAVICFPGKSDDADATPSPAEAVAEEDLLEIKVKDVRSLCSTQSLRVLLKPLPVHRASDGTVVYLTKQETEHKAISINKDIHMEQTSVDCKDVDEDSTSGAIHCELNLNNSEDLPTTKETKSISNEIDSATRSSTAMNEADVVMKLSDDDSDVTGCNENELKPEESDCALKNIDPKSTLKSGNGLTSGAKNLNNNHSSAYQSNPIKGTIETSTNSTSNHTNPSCRRPCILIFDSLRGTSRSKTAAILREYLSEEWKCRKSSECGERVFTPGNMKMCSPQVPQQDNYSDCGLFLLHYVEKMFQNPIQDFTTFSLRSLQQWFNPDEVKSKRSKIKEVIESLTTVHSSDFS